jgi:hypothetical protein
MAASGERAVEVATPGLREAILVWALHGVFLVLTFVTYARVPEDELYHVSRDGLAGGASRALVELNYPVALAALPILGICAARLRRRAATAAALAGAVLCGTVPFVVDEADLDARPVNTLPALGVAVAGVLTAWALRAGGLGASAGRLPGDAARGAVAAVALVASVPWLFAEAGLYAPDPILADEIPAGEPLPAVHLGSHHGMEGVVLVLTALLLSRAVPAVRERLAGWVSASLALMLAYGAAIAAEDVWHEQVVKRGTAAWRLPDMVLPSLGWGWLGIVVGATVIELAWFRRERTTAPVDSAPGRSSNR